MKVITKLAFLLAVMFTIGSALAAEEVITDQATTEKATVDQATAEKAAADQATAEEANADQETAVAENGEAPAKEDYTGYQWKDFVDDFHKPTEGLTLALDFRFREVYGWNLFVVGLGNGNRHFQRYRTRFGAKLDINEDISINSRLVWEFRTWDNISSNSTISSSTDFDEMIFDVLNVDIKNFLNMDATARVGRQTIILGEGWLVLDGTPLDGSRTIYFDAARVTWNLTDASTLDTIFISQHAASDKWLKPIGDVHRAVTEQDEYGAILYYTDKSLEDTRIDGYFIYKNDNPVDGSLGASIGPGGSWSKKAEIYTLGGVFDRDFGENWKLRLEGAFQTGDKDDATKTSRSLTAYGTKDRLTYSFKDERNTQAHLIYEYLSGDDPNTKKNEAFDPLWGEWPQFSEYYVYSYAIEGMVGETTNLQRVAAGLDFDLTKKARLKLAYHLLYANENTYKARTAFFSNSGNFRGQLMTGWLIYSIQKNLKGHLLAEYFLPGGYYASNARDDGYFLRFNIEYVF